MSLRPPSPTGPDRMPARERVLVTLRQHGALSRAELARLMAVAPSTVSALVADLLEAGILVELGGNAVAGRGPGRPGTLVALDRSNGVVAGIDIGKQHIRVTLADLAHQIVAERTRRLPRDPTAAGDISCAAELLDESLSGIGATRDHVVAVGMGIPGPIRRGEGRPGVGDSTILPGWAGVDAATAATTRLGIPVVVDNDANLGALSEWMWGAARGFNDVAYVKVATGIGCGLIIGGRPYQGAGGTAGELGHFMVDPTGPLCRCGNRGCLEATVGGDAMLDVLRRVHGDGLSLADVIRRGRAGEADFVHALAKAGTTIGTSLAALCNLLNPACIVIGGEMAAAEELLIEPIRQSLEKSTIGSASQDLSVVVGELGDRAEALGAVALALRARTQTTGTAHGSSADE